MITEKPTPYRAVFAYIEYENGFRRTFPAYVDENGVWFIAFNNQECVGNVLGWEYKQEVNHE